MLKIKLVALNKELLEAWKTCFKDVNNVEFILGDITETSCDAIVSPANSFGFMDGGLDLALSHRFGWGVQTDLQAAINSLDEKELLIGRSLTIETGDELVPYLISAPTMRVPMSFNIATSVNAYLAMKAILIACRNNKNIDVVAIPGLCTGCGRMPAKIAANQMFIAYDEVINGKIQTFKEFGEAQKYQYKINETGLIWDF